MLYATFLNKSNNIKDLYFSVKPLQGLYINEYIPRVALRSTLGWWILPFQGNVELY